MSLSAALLLAGALAAPAEAAPFQRLSYASPWLVPGGCDQLSVALRSGTAVVSCDGLLRVLRRDGEAWRLETELDTGASIWGDGSWRKPPLSFAVDGERFAVGIDHAVEIAARSADGRWRREARIERNGFRVALSGKRLLIASGGLGASSGAFLFERGDDGHWVERAAFPESASPRYGPDAALDADLAVVFGGGAGDDGRAQLHTYGIRDGRWRHIGRAPWPCGDRSWRDRMMLRAGRLATSCGLFLADGRGGWRAELPFESAELGAASGDFALYGVRSAPGLGGSAGDAWIRKRGAEGWTKPLSLREAMSAFGLIAKGPGMIFASDGFPFDLALDGDDAIAAGAGYAFFFRPDRLIQDRPGSGFARRTASRVSGAFHPADDIVDPVSGGHPDCRQPLREEHERCFRKHLEKASSSKDCRVAGDALHWTGLVPELRACLARFGAPAEDPACAWYWERGDVASLLAQGCFGPDSRSRLLGFPAVTPLMRAAEENQLEWQRRLAGLRADPNARDPSGRTALHVAYTDSTWLLDLGADPNLRDDRGFTPALTWARKGLIARFMGAELEALVKAGVDLNARAPDGGTVLHWIARSDWQAPSSPETLEQDAMESLTGLIRAGADLRLRDGAGRTAREVARLRGREKFFAPRPAPRPEEDPAVKARKRKECEEQFSGTYFVLKRREALCETQACKAAVLKKIRAAVRHRDVVCWGAKIPPGSD